jgi:hypothetical protein
MWTRSRIVLALLLLGLSAAKGDGLSTSVSPQLGGGIGGFDGGISFRSGAGGGGGADCIEYQTGACILYDTGSSNSILWH